MSFQCSRAIRPEPGCGGRYRRCLLKGCEQRFVPSRPQSRYCGAACARSAARWRRWQSSRRYRSSESGRERRRAQRVRYRRRRRERVAAEAVVVDASPPADLISPAREGQRAAEIPEDFAMRSCHRPGCYAEFAVRSADSSQRFCSVACRLALRRVLDRESRWRWRRRRGSARRVIVRRHSPDPP